MITQRILRELPSGLNVVRESTPIVYFGHYNTATACTISLNPSSREFLDNSGNLLEGSMARLLSRRALCKEDSERLSIGDSEEVIQACETYFENRPYSWFNKYEKFINHYSYSYYDGSCVHLDLVQWATDPIWRFIPQACRTELLQQDTPLLLHLLSNQFQHMFLNGETVVLELSSKIDMGLSIEELQYQNKRMKVYSGSYNDARVIGWSAYLQSARVPGYEDVDQLVSLIKSRTRA